MVPIPEYWRAVAKAINAEDDKLSLFVNHLTGLGTAREAILRNFLVAHTPEPQNPAKMDYRAGNDGDKVRIIAK